MAGPDLPVEKPSPSRQGAPVRIRIGQPGDEEAVAAIEKEAFTNPWHLQTFRALLTRDGVHFLVAEGEDGILGYAVMWWAGDEGELGNLAVERSRRGRGVGSALLDRLLEGARKRGVRRLFLEVRMSNEGAFRLYRSRGFIQVSVRPGYYRNPREDARILLKELQEGEA